MSLDALAQVIRSCTKCPLHQSCTAPVPLSGPTPCNLLIVGEAPGQHEDERGTPFVGSAGNMLRSSLAMAGFQPNREVAYCNVVSCRPPGNRDPLDDEVDACRTNFLAQLYLANPIVVLLCGGVALRSIRPDLNQGITHHRGRAMKLQSGQVAIPTLHPAAVLRKSAWQAHLEADCKQAKDWIRGTPHWPDTCAVCGQEWEILDPMMVPYCRQHRHLAKGGNQFPVLDNPVQLRLEEV